MTLPTKRTSITDQLRRCIDASGMSRYAICKAVGLSQSTMSRFMAGTSGLSFDVLDRIGALLGLRILADAKPMKSKEPAKYETREEKHQARKGPANLPHNLPQRRGRKANR